MYSTYFSAGDAAIDIRLKTVSKDLVKQIKTDEKVNILVIA